MNRSRRPIVAGFVALFAVVLQSTHGRIVHVDGSADFRLVLCHRNALVCDRYVTGDRSHELFAIDPGSGAKLWSFKDRSWTWTAAGEGSFIYHETGGVLFKRNVTNGVIVWQTPLNSVPAQKLNLPFSVARTLQEARATMASILRGPSVTVPMLSIGPTVTTPTRYGYQAPILSGSKLLIARSATAGGGCVIATCFDDWLFLDPQTGRVLDGGDGRFQGRLGSMAMFNARDPNTGGGIIFGIQNGSKCNVRPFITSGGESLDLTRLVDRQLSRLISWGSQQLLVESEGDGSALVFDWEKDTITRLSSADLRSRASGNWKLLPNHLVHYLTRDHYYAAAGEPKLPPTIDLFDTRGKLLSTWKARASSEPGVLGINWTGPLGDKCVVFTGWRAMDSANGRQITTDDLLLFDVPTLRLRRVIKFGERPLIGGVRSGRTFHTIAGCPYVFILTGDVTLYTMDAKTLPHELKVEAVDPASGQIIWCHREKVFLCKS